jgi:hypothetical protein
MHLVDSTESIWADWSIKRFRVYSINVCQAETWNS